MQLYIACHALMAKFPRNLQDFPGILCELLWILPGFALHDGLIFCRDVKEFLGIVAGFALHDG